MVMLANWFAQKNLRQQGGIYNVYNQGINIGDKTTSNFQN